MKSKIRIVLADDMLLLRKSLVSLLNEHSYFEVVGEVSNGRELIDLLKEIKPDIVLLDIEMPVMNGFDALKIIQQRFPELKVLVLTAHNELTYIKESIAMGAKGFLSKTCGPEQLVNTILSVQKNGFFLEESVSRELFNNMFDRKRKNEKQILSLREQEVLNLLCLGYSEPEIANKLCISGHTVHFHRANIYIKTSTHNLSQLLKYKNAQGVMN